jgi:transcriptional regulator with XRE-family HTH domain
LHQAENGQAEVANRTEFTTESEVLLHIQKGESQRKLAGQYGVSKTTIANIKKNEHSIINSVDSNSSKNRKREMRRTENEEVNNIRLESFIKSRSQNIPVTSPMLQTKAVEIASSSQIEKFSASSGWLGAFWCRNNINFRVW